MPGLSAFVVVLFVAPLLVFGGSTADMKGGE